MKRFVVLLAMASILLMVWGCGYKEGVRQPGQQAYVLFSGNVSGAVATIDDNPSFELKGSGSADPDASRTLYEVAPGKHRVVVKRNGQVVVNREVLIGNGATKEVRVP